MGSGLRSCSRLRKQQDLLQSGRENRGMLSGGVEGAELRTLRAGILKDMECLIKDLEQEKQTGNGLVQPVFRKQPRWDSSPCSHLEVSSRPCRSQARPLCSQTIRTPK